MPQMSAPPIDYHDRRFRVIETSASGEVGGETRFHYRQLGEVVWATYEGGGVRLGTLVAAVGDGGTLDMRYAHVNAEGELMTGTCVSTPEVLPDGRLRLHEQWQWTSGDRSTGASIVEEVAS
ncbi:MAG: hypothetical protein Rubg2KO_11380 [Rubricoccaceae bacterium]